MCIRDRSYSSWLNNFCGSCHPGTHKHVHAQSFNKTHANCNYGHPYITHTSFLSLYRHPLAQGITIKTCRECCFLVVQFFDCFPKILHICRIEVYSGKISPYIHTMHRHDTVPLRFILCKILWISHASELMCGIEHYEWHARQYGSPRELFCWVWQLSVGCSACMVHNLQEATLPVCDQHVSTSPINSNFQSTCIVQIVGNI